MSRSHLPLGMLAYQVDPTLAYFNRLAKYYINLEARHDRRAMMEHLFPTPAVWQQTQPQEGSAVDATEQDQHEASASEQVSLSPGQASSELGDFVPFSRWVACNGRAAQAEGRLVNMFANDLATTHYQIPCTPAQQGCTISHMNLYQEIIHNRHIAEHDWVLIAEDDNNFIPEFPQRLNAVLEQLNQPRFSHANLVILRYCEFGAHCDFVDEVYNWSPQGGVQYSNPLKREFFHPDFFEAVRCRNRSKSSWSFAFPESAPAHPQGLYGTHFTLMVPTRMIPWSSSLYLIRKSACRQICNNYYRPWWVADDFQALFPEHQILLVSPVFAVDYDNEISQSDVQNSAQLVRSRRARVFNQTNFARQRQERRLQFLLKYYYGKSRKKRSLARALYKLCGLETKRWERHDLP